MADHPTTRRQLLTATAGLAAATLAGCTGAGSGGQTTETTHDDGHDDGHDETTVADDDHSHHDGHHHEDLPESPSDHVTVEMVTRNGGFHFEPHVAWVAEGGTVTFVNESGSHTATAYHPGNDTPLRTPEAADAWDSGTLTEAGAEFEHTFETPGVYDYYCVPHESMGMAASLIVGEPDPHDQPGLSEPQDSLPGEMPAKIESLNEKCNEVLGHTHE